MKNWNSVLEEYAKQVDDPSVASFHKTGLLEGLKKLMDHAGPGSSLVYAVAQRKDTNKWIVYVEAHTNCSLEDHSTCKIAGLLEAPVEFDTVEPAQEFATAMGEMVAPLLGQKTTRINIEVEPLASRIEPKEDNSSN